MAEVEEGLAMEDPHGDAVGGERHRRVTAGVAIVSLAVGIIIGSVATLALAPTSSDLVSTGAEGFTASTLQDLVEVGDHPLPVQVPGQSSTENTPLAPVDTSMPPPPMSQGSTGQLPPPRQRFVATLEAEPGWAPTDYFAGTITVVEAHDGSWHAEVDAEGLQPRHRHGAGVTWDAPFLSSFCIGMSDDSGRWTCTGRIDMQYVPKGAKLISGDLGEGSGRIWAHGPIRPA